MLFIGTTRRDADGRQTESLAYECYEPMALEALRRLEQTARERWPIGECSMVHRIGDVPVGQVSVAIAVSAPHRREAFEAGQWLIDSLKQSVPIWKQERYADGTVEWQHPQSASEEPSSARVE